MQDNDLLVVDRKVVWFTVALDLLSESLLQLSDVELGLLPLAHRLLVISLLQSLQLSLSPLHLLPEPSSFPLALLERPLKPSHLQQQLLPLQARLSRFLPLLHFPLFPSLLLLLNKRLLLSQTVFQLLYPRLK